MSNHMTALGHARVFRDDRTGKLVVDTDSIRRTSFAGDETGNSSDGPEYGAEPEYGDEREDDRDDDRDDIEGESENDDELDELGWSRRSKRSRDRKQDRRQDRRQNTRQTGHQATSPQRMQQSQARQQLRNERRSERREEHSDDAQNIKENTNMSNPPGWGMTAISGSTTSTAAGAVSVAIRPQHDFRATDITFEGSTAGATVTSIFFGDQAVWSNSSGIPVNVFASGSFMRNLLKGQQIRAGLDIVINGTLPGAGTFTATLMGLKPHRQSR